MEARCSCGAVLPEGARFCHKCGKPQFEEDIERLEEQERSAVTQAPVQSPIEPPIEARAAPSPISFKNSRAVVISLLVAIGAMIGLLPLALWAAPLFLPFLCAIGYVAVRLYRGRSAEPLSMSAGAFLGWMTGLWIFIVTSLLLALTSVVVASPTGWEQLRATWAQVPQTAKLLSLTQHEFLVQMLVMLPFSFLLLTILPGLGGILGAAVSGRRRIP